MSALRRTLESLGIEDTDIPATEAMTYFRWQHGLQYARPIKKVFLRWPDAQRKPTAVTYCSRRLYSRVRSDECNTSTKMDEVVIVDFIMWPLYSICIWDLSSDSFRKLGRFSDLWLWHIGPDGDMLVAFEVDWGKYPLEVQKTKWTLGGWLLERNRFLLSRSDRRMNKEKNLELSKASSIRGSTCFAHMAIKQQEFCHALMSAVVYRFSSCMITPLTS